ncbi:glycosyltransferase [Acidiplasma sp.]|uniref:glycosyltransferase family 4 protein n=1 Tax=Acidiplasma sp. TaxID=1872114 RepID=UPI00315FE381
MRILEISYRNPYGKNGAGVESYIYKLANFLKSNKNIVEIAYASENKINGCSPMEVYIPKFVWKIGLAKFYYNLKLYFIVNKNKSAYDIIHINGDNGSLIPFIKGAKTLMTLHGSISETLKLRTKSHSIKYIISYILDSINGFFEIASCRKSQMVISVSEHTAMYFKEITGRNDINVINTCIEPPYKINKNFDIIYELKNSGRTLLLWVGRDPVRKGLNIAKRAIKGMDNVTLITAGYNDENPQENVVNLGYVDNDLLQAIYQITDIILFPSINEGFSIGLLEAMSYGCIPVAFSIPSTNELIKDGENGFIVNNEDELKQKLSWLVNNKYIIKQIRPNVISRASDYYCNKILPKIYSLMGELNQSQNHR